MIRFDKKPRSRQRGAVLAEMALVTPILLVLLLVTADLSRAFIEHNTLTKAVRNGARFVAGQAFQGTTGVINVTTTLVDETRNLVVYGTTTPPGGAATVLPGFTLTNVTVAQVAGTDDIVVSATYALGGLFGPLLPISFYGGTDISTARTLNASVTMRAL